MRPLGGFSLVGRAIFQRVTDTDALDDEHLVLNNHVALTFAGQPALTGVDPARLQRATQGAGESTSRRGDHVIERRGMVGVLTGSGAVVLANLVVGPEQHRLRLRR